MRATAATLGWIRTAVIGHFRSDSTDDTGRSPDWPTRRAIPASADGQDDDARMLAVGIFARVREIIIPGDEDALLGSGKLVVKRVVALDMAEAHGVLRAVAFALQVSRNLFERHVFVEYAVPRDAATHFDYTHLFPKVKSLRFAARKPQGSDPAPRRRALAPAVRGRATLQSGRARQPGRPSYPKPRPRCATALSAWPA